MAERTVELEKPMRTDEAEQAIRTATERAERAEAEVAKLRSEAQPVAREGISGAAALKQPPSPSTAQNAPETSSQPSERGSVAVGGEAELRKDPMMSRLLDALADGEDVGHYGRLIFAMVARHFLPHDEVLSWLTKDPDFSEEQARVMLRQVDSRDYNPPKRERLVEWQSEQEFQFLDAGDPDSGNLYRNLKFPDEIYEHIEHYQEAKAETV